MDIKQINETADNLFSKKAPLNSLHQEIADNFYSERADFTLSRSLGTDFASNLMSSYPVRCRRDLGNQFSTMLRPTARPWFHPGIRHEAKIDHDVKGYLEWFELIQRKAMYDPHALLTRATKEGDHDFAAFGQAALSVELNKNANGLLYRCWHLRDMCWQENEEGTIGFVARKWKPMAQTLVRIFGDKVDQKVKDIAGKTPFEEMECRHFVVDADMYDDDAKGRPRWSLWYDVTHSKLLEATPIWHKHYVIPRWQTVSGSQYSYSPATVCALPDARLLQAMTYTLLEAGEKATSPPMLATQNAVRSDLALYAGGVTWVDEEYDERLGAALRPLEQDFRGFNYGLQMNADTRQMLHAAFFLDALTLPQRAPEMTAYEVSQRVQEYIRNALPIFEPMEMEYNAALCDETFDLLWRNGAFGDPRSWPKKLHGADIAFSFESPLHDAIEQQKGQKFQEAQALIGAAIALDPSCAFLPKTEVALREALQGIGVPATWVNSESFVEDAKANQQASMAAQQKLALVQQASEAAKNIGQSGMVPQSQVPAAA
jgi:hypothetical protein